MRQAFKLILKKDFVYRLHKQVTYFVLISLLTSPAMATANSCRSIFSGGEVSTVSVQSLLKISKNDLMILNKQTDNGGLKFPFGIAEQVLEKVLNKVNKLTPTEREALLKAMESSSPFTESLVNDSIKLILGDKVVWKTYLKSVVNEMPSLMNFAPVSGFWAVQVKGMPLETRMHVLKLIGEVYDSARSSSDGHGSPKRELDYLVHSLLQGGEIMKSAIDQGLSPLQAYDLLLNKQQQTLLAKSKKRGGYSSEAVVAVLKAVHNKVHTEGLGPVLLGGSFTAGRANLRSSDIDFMTDDPRYFEKDLEKDFNKDIQKALADLGVTSSLVFENFPGELGKPRDRSYLDDLASSNSVLFYIDKNEIQMLVYETKPWQRGQAVEFFMTTPTSYKITP